MDAERSLGSKIFSFLGSVLIFAFVGALIWGFGHWLYYDYTYDTHHWDLDTMTTDTKAQLVARLKMGGFGGGVLGVLAYFLAAARN